MGKFIKKIINSLLYVIFLFVKEKSKKANVYTFISKALFNKNNQVEFDESINSYWLKHNDEYLYAVSKPIYNFSKQNLYKSILDIYCKEYIPKVNDIIVDIGAGIGTELLFFNEKNNESGIIYSVEASTNSYSKLEALCKKNKFENTFNFNIAISNFDGKIHMEETEKFEVNQINKIGKGIQITCKTFDSFIRINNITKINFLKINIEGAEIEMIQGMENSIKIIDNIAISCHDFLFKNERNIKKNIVQFLRNHNFDITFNNTGNKVIDSWIYAKRK